MYRIASSTGRGYLVIITASCQELKNPFPGRPDYQPNRMPKRPNATVNKFRILTIRSGNCTWKHGGAGNWPKRGRVGLSRKSAPIVSTWRAPRTTAVSLSRSPRFAQNMSRSSSRSSDSRGRCLVPRLDPQIRAEDVSFLVSILRFARKMSRSPSRSSDSRGRCLDPQIRAEDVSFPVSIVRGAPMRFIEVVSVRPKEARCFVNTLNLYHNINVR